MYKRKVMSLKNSTSMSKNSCVSALYSLNPEDKSLRLGVKN